MLVEMAPARAKVGARPPGSRAVSCCAVSARRRCFGRARGWAFRPGDAACDRLPQRCTRRRRADTAQRQRPHRRQSCRNAAQHRERQAGNIRPPVDAVCRRASRGAASVRLATARRHQHQPEYSAGARHVQRGRRRDHAQHRLRLRRRRREPASGRQDQAAVGHLARPAAARRQRHRHVEHQRPGVGHRGDTRDRSAEVHGVGGRVACRRGHLPLSAPRAQPQGRRGAPAVRADRRRAARSGQAVRLSQRVQPLPSEAAHRASAQQRRDLRCLRRRRQPRRGVRARRRDSAAGRVLAFDADRQ